MSNKIVQLENEAGDNIYPLAGGALTGSITKTMLEEGVFEGPELSEPSSVAYVATDNIQDGAVTSDKMDSATFDLTTITPNIGSWNGNRQYLKRVGDIVFVQATVSGVTLAAGTLTDFFTIPESFRPTTAGQVGKNQVFLASSYPNNNTGSLGGAYLHNQGSTIKVWLQTAISNKELTVQGFYIL